jgi:hypothetical protein
MKRLFCLSVAALLGWTVMASAAPILCHRDYCRETPAPNCQDCSEPCCNGWHLGASWKEGRVHKLVCDLQACDCCTRIRAAKHLGMRLNGNFCCNHDLLPALLHALLCDPCWEVRQAAAWSIAMQGARTQVAVVALYVSSKLDRHYLVRDRAREALDILTLCRTECYKELYRAADALIGQLRSRGIRPGVDNCLTILENLGACSAAVTSAAPNAEPMPGTMKKVMMQEVMQAEPMVQETAPSSNGLSYMSSAPLTHR